jgi:hypothetical protein
MLFTIYAPAKIPQDINVFKLYQEYWHFRIEQDYRAGSPISSVKSADLRDVAAVVALGMLAEGTPEIDVQRLSRSVDELGHSGSGIDELTSRGVLHHSEIGTIAFFHQTFFEHSAARGLLSYLGIEGLSALNQRLLSKDYDLFVSPVYEQALLLAEDEALPISKLADELLNEMINTRSVAAASSGIYIYCHRKQVPETIRTSIRETLANGDESTIVRFITLAPNVSAARMPALFQELDVIWNRKKWREQEHLLELLERFVARYPASVKDFISEHQILQYTLTLPPTYAGNRKLLRVLSALGMSDPGWSWDSLLALFKGATAIAESRDLQISVLNCLCENPNIFGETDIASRFEAETTQLGMNTARDLPELADAYGRLWAIEWEASGTSVSQMLTDISSFESGLKLIARTRGLAYILLSAGRDEIDSVFEHFARETRHLHRALWARSILSHLLRGVDARTEKSPSENPSPGIQYARQNVACLLAEGAGRLSHIASGSIGIQDRETICRAIRDANLPSDLFRQLFSNEIFSDLEVWLDDQQFAPLLIEGFAANHSGATAAMRVLMQKTEVYWPKLRRMLSTRLINLASGELEQMKTFFDLVLKVEDSNALLRALEQIAPPAPSVLMQRKDQIASFSRRMRASRSGVSRRSGTRLWAHLLRLNMVPAPPLDQLTALLSAEDDSHVRCQIIETISQATTKVGYDIEEVLQALEPLAKSNQVGIRDLAMNAIVKAVLSSTTDAASFAMRLLEIALAPQTNAGRLISLRPILLRLVPTDAELAGRIVERMITEATGAGLGVNGSRKLLGRFKPTVRLVIRKASKEQMVRFLTHVPKLDRILGSLIVDAICHECLTEMRAELDELLKGNALGDIKEIVLRYRYSHERTSGAEDWSEIYTLMKSRPRPSRSL